MPKITSIKQQKNKNRVNIYLDGKFAFGIDLENFVIAHLKVEQELTEDEVAEIIKKAEFQKTLDKLLRFAMLRPRSKKEVESWVRRKKIHQSIQEGLFDKLKHFELIDDEKFAKWWIDQRTTFRKKSKKVIKQELLLKGVAREIIDDALSVAEIDEKSLALETLKKKYYRWQKLPLKERKQKMTEYLLRAGFSWSDVNNAIDDVTLEKV